MDICVVLDNDKIIDMFNEMGNAAKDFNSMTKQTKINILEGVKEKFSSRDYVYLDVNIVIEELVNNPYKYLFYYDEFQDCVTDILNDLRNEYEDLENKIEELYDLSDIPGVDEHIDQLTEKINEIDSILAKAEKLIMESNWKEIANLLKIPISIYPPKRLGIIA